MNQIFNIHEVLNQIEDIQTKINISYILIKDDQSLAKSILDGLEKNFMFHKNILLIFYGKLISFKRSHI